MLRTSNVLLWAAALGLATAAAPIVQSRAATAAVATGAIVFVGTDDNIHYAGDGGAKPECLTCPTEGLRVRREPGVLSAAYQPAEEKSEILKYAWPTFSPDGTRIAYSSVGQGPHGQSFAVWVYDLAHRQAAKIYQSRNERVVYIYWLADNKHISFLLDEPAGLSLMLCEAKEGAPLRIVMTGIPLYFDWRSSGDRLVFHSSGSDAQSTERVGLLSVTDTNQQVDKVLSSGRTPFKTPCWSPDGKHLAYIANYHAESNIVVADANGDHVRSIVSLPVGDNSLVWSPDSRHLAYATTVVPHEPTFHGIKLVDIQDASSHDLTQDEVLAYFFSPDGRYLAYIGVPSEKPYYVWKVVNLKNNETRDLGRFFTTDEEAIAYRFFEQLALSHSIWSTNSNAITFAGVRLLVEPNAELQNTRPPSPSVWVVPIDGSNPRQVDNGVQAFFSAAQK